MTQKLRIGTPAGIHTDSHAGRQKKNRPSLPGSCHLNPQQTTRSDSDRYGSRFSMQIAGCSRTAPRATQQHCVHASNFHSLWILTRVLSDTVRREDLN